MLRNFHGSEIFAILNFVLFDLEESCTIGNLNKVLLSTLFLRCLSPSVPPPSPFLVSPSLPYLYPLSPHRTTSLTPHLHCLHSPLPSPSLFLLNLLLPRVPSLPVAELVGHQAALNGIAWAPHSPSHICTISDDKNVSTHIVYCTVHHSGKLYYIEVCYADIK